jgi:hypothetical protein
MVIVLESGRWTTEVAITMIVLSISKLQNVSAVVIILMNASNLLLDLTYTP